MPTMLVLKHSTGDEDGAWTFYGSRRRRSVIDYVIASPQLAFAAQGRVLRGARLHMLHHPERLPLRPGAADDGTFDLMPVGVRFRTPRTRTAAAPPTVEAPVAERWIWGEELRTDYVAALGVTSVRDEQVSWVYRVLLPGHTSVDVDAHHSRMPSGQCDVLRPSPPCSSGAGTPSQRTGPGVA